MRFLANTLTTVLNFHLLRGHGDLNLYFIYEVMMQKAVHGRICLWSLNREKRLSVYVENGISIEK